MRGSILFTSVCLKFSTIETIPRGLGGTGAGLAHSLTPLPSGAGRGSKEFCLNLRRGLHAVSSRLLTPKGNNVTILFFSDDKINVNSFKGKIFYKGNYKPENKTRLSDIHGLYHKRRFS